MSTWQFLGLLSAFLLFVVKSVLQYQHNKAKGIAERLPAEGVIESLMLSVVFGTVLSIASTTLPKIESGLGALTDVVRDDPAYMALENAARARHTIEQIGDPVVRQIFSDYLTSETDAYTAALSSIQARKVEISRGKAMKFGESAFKAATVSVDTTSYVAPANWWLNNDGKKYFLTNEDALQRNVKIQRIFIYSTLEERDHLDPTIKAQKAKGITVYAVATDSLPKNMNRDIIIVDDKIVGELFLDEKTRDFDKVVVKIQPEDIKRAREDWNTLIRLAKKI